MKITKIPFHILIDIDPIFNKLNFLDGYSECFGTRHFQHFCEILDFQSFEISKHIIIMAKLNGFFVRFFLIYFESFGGSKVKQSGFGSQNMFKNEKIMNMWGSRGFPE